MARDTRKMKLRENQIGDEEGGKEKSANFSLYSLMILTLLFRYIDLLNTVLRLVGSILGNGLDHLLPQEAYSKSWNGHDSVLVSDRLQGIVT